MMSEKTELKPCPFCGNTNIRIALCSELTCDLQPNEYCEHCEGRTFGIICSALLNGCGTASGLYKTKEQAIKAWNRRIK